MDDAELPKISLRSSAERATESLRSLQLLALKHPVAFQAAFGALVAEGRQFARSAEGAQWRTRLEHSSLLHRTRLALELGTLWMLEDQPEGPLPSGLVDALFLAAESPELESIVDNLFEEMVSEPSD